MPARSKWRKARLRPGRRSCSSLISDDQRILAILIAFCFGALLESLAGAVAGFVLWPALAAGLLLALVAGPLGSLLVWRRLAYFGDSLAHAALLGVGLSLLLAIPGWIGIALVCAVVAGLLATLPRLRLVQSLAAGVDHLTSDPRLPAQVPLCRIVDPEMDTVTYAELQQRREQI